MTKKIDKMPMDVEIEKCYFLNVNKGLLPK